MKHIKDQWQSCVERGNSSLCVRSSRLIPQSFMDLRINFVISNMFVLTSFQEFAPEQKPISRSSSPNARGHHPVKGRMDQDNSIYNPANANTAGDGQNSVDLHFEHTSESGFNLADAIGISEHEVLEAFASFDSENFNFDEDHFFGLDLLSESAHSGANGSPSGLEHASASAPPAAGAIDTAPLFPLNSLGVLLEAPRMDAPDSSKRTPNVADKAPNAPLPSSLANVSTSQFSEQTADDDDIIFLGYVTQNPSPAGSFSARDAQIPNPAQVLATMAPLHTPHVQTTAHNSYSQQILPAHATQMAYPAHGLTAIAPTHVTDMQNLVHSSYSAQAPYSAPAMASMAFERASETQPTEYAPNDHHHPVPFPDHHPYHTTPPIPAVASKPFAQVQTTGSYVHAPNQMVSNPYVATDPAGHAPIMTPMAPCGSSHMETSDANGIQRAPMRTSKTNVSTSRKRTKEHKFVEPKVPKRRRATKKTDAVPVKKTPVVDTPTAPDGIARCPPILPFQICIPLQQAGKEEEIVIRLKAILDSYKSGSIGPDELKTKGMAIFQGKPHYLRGLEHYLRREAEKTETGQK